MHGGSSRPKETPTGHSMSDREGVLEKARGHLDLSERKIYSSPHIFMILCCSAVR